MYNNAGVANFLPVDQMSDEDFNKLISINLTGVFYGIKYNIRANTVNPGYIYTGMINEKTMGEDGIKRLESLHPLGRLGGAEEIAHGVVFLVETEAR